MCPVHKLYTNHCGPPTFCASSLAKAKGMEQRFLCLFAARETLWSLRLVNSLLKKKKIKILQRNTTKSRGSTIYIIHNSLNDLEDTEYMKKKRKCEPKTNQWRLTLR